MIFHAQKTIRRLFNFLLQWQIHLKKPSNLIFQILLFVYCQSNFHGNSYSYNLRCCYCCCFCSAVCLAMLRTQFCYTEWCVVMQGKCVKIWFSNYFVTHYKHEFMVMMLFITVAVCAWEWPEYHTITHDNLRIVCWHPLYQYVFVMGLILFDFEIDFDFTYLIDLMNRSGFTNEFNGNITSKKNSNINIIQD